MKFVFEKIATFILGLVFLWLLFMFLGWVWDHKGAIFLLVAGMTAIGVVVFLLSNKDSNMPDELMMADNMSGDKNSSSLTDKKTEQLKVDDKQVLTSEIQLDKAEVGMSELTHMLQIIDPEYVQRTLSQIYSDVEKKVGRGINKNEEALIAAAIFIGLTQAQNDSDLRIKKSKSLARASSLAVMRALAFNIDEEASTGLFREKLDISQASIDKEIINTIDSGIAGGIAGGIADNTFKVLDFARDASSRKDILIHLSLVNNANNFENHIQPLVSMGWLTMTIPDKPTSPNQKYLTTLKGRLIVKFLKLKKS